MMMTYKQAFKQFVAYGNKVVKSVARQEPKATFSMRFIMNCFGNNVPYTRCANNIVSSWRDLKVYKRARKIKGGE